MNGRTDPSPGAGLRSSGRPEAHPEPAYPVLLYDGSCGLCSAVVQFVLQRDRRQTLRFASLDSAFALQVRTAFPDVATVDSVVWLEPGARRVLVRSDAVRALARYLGGPWRAVAAIAVIPRPLRDWAYDLVARHRRRLSGRTTACLVPGPEAQHRFLVAWYAPPSAPRRP